MTTKLLSLLALALLFAGCERVAEEMVSPAYASNAAYPGACVPKPAFTVSYNDPMFRVANITATKTLFTLASTRQMLCTPGTMDPKIGFTWASNDAGAAITKINCSLGSANNPAIYLLPLDVTQTAQGYTSSGAFNTHYMAGDSSLAVVLYCTTTGGGNLGTGSSTNLTAGKLWINVSTLTLPAGAQLSEPIDQPLYAEYVPISSRTRLPLMDIKPSGQWIIGQCKAMPNTWEAVQLPIDIANAPMWQMHYRGL
jgi:hypothetical protein